MNMKTTYETDLIAIKKIALEVFNTEKMANQWLNSFNSSIGDTPISILNTQNGVDEVKKILSAIAYGGVL